MMRKLLEEKERDFFDQYSGMVHGALKRLGVWHMHPDYDDFVHQGFMKLVEAYETYLKTWNKRSVCNNLVNMHTKSLLAHN